MRVRSHITLLTQTSITEKDLEESSQASECFSEAMASETMTTAEPSSIDSFDFPAKSKWIVNETNQTSLSFSEAAQILASAKDVTTIVRTSLRHAKSFFSRVCFFVVKRGVAVAWDSIGLDINQDEFFRIRIPLEGDSVFRLVSQNRAHYLGGLSKTSVHIKFLRSTGKIIPLSIFLMPIFMRGRMISILYGDNGHKKHCKNEIGELLILAQHIGRRYETLLDNTRDKSETKS